jgi:hypothetical protein
MGLIRKRSCLAMSSSVKLLYNMTLGGSIRKDLKRRLIYKRLLVDLV